jgi:site-specific recombinase XerD
MNRQYIKDVLAQSKLSVNSVKTYEPILIQWMLFCSARKIDPTQVPSDEIAQEFIGVKKQDGTKSVARAALRFLYSSMSRGADGSVPGITRIGSSMNLKRNKRKKPDPISRDSLRSLEIFISSKMYSKTIYMAILSLICSGVNVGRIVQLKYNDFSQRKNSDGEMTYMVRKTASSSKFIEVRGTFAKSVDLRITQMSSNGSSIFAESCRGNFTRQGIWKMMKKSGVYSVPGISNENIFGCALERKVSLMSNNSARDSQEESKEKVKEHVGERAAKTPIFDPSTNKMKILIGNGRFIETELTSKFVDHLQKQGYKVEYKDVKPSEKLEEAAKSIFGDRMQAVMTDAIPMATMADMSPEKAMQMMRMTVDASFRGIQTDAEQTIKFVDAVIAWMVINRACVLAGKIDP